MLRGGQLWQCRRTGGLDLDLSGNDAMGTRNAIFCKAKGTSRRSSELEKSMKKVQRYRLVITRGMER